MQSLLDHLRDKSHVIWDWNGTLLNDVPHAVATMNGMLAPRGLPLLDVPRYRGAFGFPIRNYYEVLGFDLQSEPLADLCDSFVDAFMAKIFDCALVPGSRELLQGLKSAGRTQSVLSATDQSNLQRMIAGFELTPYFDFVFGVEGTQGAGKVRRGHELMHASGIAPGHTVLIGDTDHDLEVGHALGISVILVTHGHQSAERLRRVHDNVVDVAAA